jgi:hypothetical protein
MRSLDSIRQDICNWIVRNPTRESETQIISIDINPYILRRASDGGTDEGENNDASECSELRKRVS